jgi:hypothetical protein
MKLSLEISVSYRSGLVRGTFMQAWFRVGLSWLLGLAVCFKFLIETITARNG